MSKYSVEFEQEPVISLGLGRKGTVGRVLKTIEEDLGFSMDEKVKSGIGNVVISVEEKDFTEEEFLQLTNLYKDSTRFSINMRLRELKALAEEVIEKDTGVDVRGKVWVSVDYFVYTVGLALKESDFTKEELKQLGDYSVKDPSKNIEIVLKNYYNMLGNKEKETIINVRKKDVGDELDELCTISIEKR